METILFLGFIALFIYAFTISGRLKKLEHGNFQSALAKPQASSSVVQKKTSTVPNGALVNGAAFATPIKSTTPIKQGEAFDSHSFINALPKVGVVALVIGLGFFLKYAIDEGWISVTVRLLMGGAIGTLLLLLSYIWREKYEKYALALAGGGLAIWYLTVWAAVQLYMVLSPNGGLILLAVVSLTGVLMAYQTGSQALSALSWGGAYLVPVILSIGTGQYGLLLTYLTILNTALLITILYNRALHLYLLALFGSLINVLWTTMDNGIPGEQYLYTLAFLFINLFIFSVVLVFSIRNETNKNLKNPFEGNEFSLISGVVHTLIAIPIAVLAYNHYWEFAPLIVGVVGVWMFIVYALVDRLEYTKVNYTLSGIGAALFALAIFWHFNQTTEIIMIYLLGLVGLIIGRIQNRAELRSWSLGITLLGILAACFIRYDYTVQTLFFSEKFGLEVLGLGMLVISYFVIKRDQLTPFEDSVHTSIQYMIAVLTWIFVSWDLVNYFNGFAELNQRNLSLSMWWLVYAIVLMALSSIVTLKPLRKFGLFLIGLVIIKVFLYDVQSLDTVYRIIAFISLGAILLGFSFIYQHNKEKIKEYLK